MATTFKLPVKLFTGTTVPSNAATGLVNYQQNTGVKAVNLFQPNLTPESVTKLLTSLAPQSGSNPLETFPSVKVSLLPSLGVSVVDKKDKTPIDFLLIGAGEITGLKTGAFTDVDFALLFPKGIPGNVQGTILQGAFKDALLSTGETSTFNFTAGSPASAQVVKLLGLPQDTPLNSITIIN